MFVLGWLILGLAAGFVASKLYAASEQGADLDIALGIVGAFLGGILFSFFDTLPIYGVHFYSMVAALIGAVVLLWSFHAVAGRGDSRPAKYP